MIDRVSIRVANPAPAMALNQPEPEKLLNGPINVAAVRFTENGRLNFGFGQVRFLA